MRTIKFRGKRYGDGAWVYGNLYQGTKEGEQYSIILDDAGYDLAPEDDRNLAIAFAENEVNVVFPDTVGQFTGLLDMNGKEIYEGDIVANDFGNAYIVNMTVEWCTDGYWALHEIDGDDTMHFVADYLNEIELIGNIYDNPELMKQNE